MIIQGIINIHSEQGVDPFPCIQNYNYIYYDDNEKEEIFKEQWSYDGLIGLKNGDYLKVYNNSELVWCGKIELYWSQKHYCYLQEDVNEMAWINMFKKEYVGVLERF